jgi:hypothetical protein
MVEGFAASDVDKCSFLPAIFLPTAPSSPYPEKASFYFFLLLIK